MPFLEALASGAAGALGDLAGTALQAHENRKTNARQMRFQQYNADTQYQRAAKDLEAAGLNRILGIGSPAPTPTGAGSSIEAPRLGTSFQQGATAKVQREMMKEQTANTSADTMKKLSEAEAAEQSIRESEARTTNIRANTAVAIAQELETRAKLPGWSIQQRLTEAEIQRTMAQTGMTRQQVLTEKENTRKAHDTANMTNVVSRGAEVVSPIIDGIVDEIITPITTGARDYVHKSGGVKGMWDSIQQWRKNRYGSKK